MSSLSGHSRRALLAAPAAAALAAAPAATAKKKGKGKGNGKGKGKPPAPLALATVLVTRLHEMSREAFTYSIEIGYVHLATGDFNGDATSIDVAPTATQAGIIAHVQEWVSFDLGRSDQDVPAERVAVTIL